MVLEAACLVFIPTEHVSIIELQDASCRSAFIENEDVVVITLSMGTRLQHFSVMIQDWNDIGRYRLYF